MDDDSSTWFPATQLGYLDGVSGSGILSHARSLAHSWVWKSLGTEQDNKNLSFSLFLSLLIPLSFK